jgi:transposase-like protein
MARRKRKQVKAVKHEMNLMKVMEDFDTDGECRAYLEHLRWPHGVACPRCGCATVSRIKERAQFDCDGCRYQFSVMSGTVLHDSKLPLPKWFMAVYLMCEARKGISANQMKRTLEVSYKTAWFLCHRVRAALADPDPKKLSGTVECDETFVGGKRRHVGAGNRANKTMVLGAIQRHGECRLKAQAHPYPSRKTLHAFIKDTVAPETAAIYTDESHGYHGIGDADTRHETVNHNSEEWVRGDVHTNTVEGVWSLFKRSIIGSFHSVSAKHLDRYLDEMEFRFNNRQNEYLFRDAMLRLLKSEAVPYRKLVA